jgi:hypothetical protein
MTAFLSHSHLSSLIRQRENYNQTPKNKKTTIRPQNYSNQVQVKFVSQILNLPATG